MKKLSSQITVAIVCCLLGFILTYQFRQINKNQESAQPRVNNEDITAQIELLTKQKEELQIKFDDQDEKIKKYESSVAGANTANSELLKELVNSRTVNGIVDVKGPGVIIELIPQNNLFNNTTSDSSITPENLAVLVNNLNSSQAEAISINDIRITSRTGIAYSGKFVEINSIKIPTDKKVTIKVIGDKKKIIYALDFLLILSEFTKNNNCLANRSTPAEIVIQKYEGNFKFNYAKPVDDK
ncbi:MAG: DUF881 domain-containing protein [Clostridiaceae bacterium]|nr:DUF881 domain-containing protein [Clostridiaceae bacterium]